MGLHHRKLLFQQSFTITLPRPGCNPCYPILNLSPPPPPPKPRPESVVPKGQNSYNQQHRLIEISMIITACMLGGALLIAILGTIIRGYNSRRYRSSRRNAPILFNTLEDFVDEDRGPVLDHPIWYINTVGLQQSVIDSITVCKYRKDEGLIDGTECSVCLSEFEEDESLRLLPKCSHAFHVSCIDTWLRSHKNCPLCRAPIVNNTAGSQVSVSEPNLSVQGSSQETQVENLENHSGVESNQVGSDGSSEGGAGDVNFGALPIEDCGGAEISMKSLHNSSSRNCHSRVLSNLADNQRVVEQEIQPMRRSVSLDSLSASMIYHAVANVVPDQGSSKTELVQLKSLRTNSIAKRDSGTSSLSKLMKSSSIGRSLQKGPISMKRSFSTSRKFFSARQGTSSSSVLSL